MKIMSLNGWGGKLHERLLRYVQAVSPDVLCLQEVIYSPATSKDWLTYRDGDHILLQRANFFRDVAEALADHVAIFCPAAQGILWDESKPVPSQWGLATFIRKSFPILAQAQNFVHKSFSPHGYGDHPRSRSAHAIQIYDYAREQPFSIAHMHGLRDLNGKMDTLERRAQAHRLAGLATSIAAPGGPLVICGDFNVEPRSETFEILAGIGLKDLVTTRAFKGTRTSYLKKPGRFADYMFFNDAVDVVDFTVVTEPEVSDHCPLILEI